MLGVVLVENGVGEKRGGPVFDLGFELLDVRGQRLGVEVERGFVA